MLSDTSNDFAPRLEGFYPCSSLPRMVNSQLDWLGAGSTRQQEPSHGAIQRREDECQYAT